MGQLCLACVETRCPLTQERCWKRAAAYFFAHAAADAYQARSSKSGGRNEAEREKPETLPNSGGAVEDGKAEATETANHDSINNGSSGM